MGRPRELPLFGHASGIMDNLCSWSKSRCIASPFVPVFCSDFESGAMLVQQ